MHFHSTKTRSIYGVEQLNIYVQICHIFHEL